MFKSILGPNTTTSNILGQGLNSQTNKPLHFQLLKRIVAKFLHCIRLGSLVACVLVFPLNTKIACIR
jgi:hypothetical protein